MSVTEMLIATCHRGGYIFWRWCSRLLAVYPVLVCLAVSALGLTDASLAQPVENHAAQAHPTFSLPPLVEEISNSQQSPVPSKILIRTVQFRGNTVLTDQQLNAIARPHIGRINGIDEIEQLRLNLSRAYIDRGFVSSGVRLTQPIDDGVLTFDVVEGRLSQLRLNGLGDLDGQYVTQRLTNGADAAFNVDVLRQRFQLLLADPLFARMNARVLPGELPGDTVVEIDTERARPYQWTVFANNYRPASIGSNTLGMSGWMRNLTSRGDVLEANIQNAFGSGAHGSLMWHIPIGFTNTQVAFGMEQGSSSVIEESVKTLGIRSELKSSDIGLSQVFVETPQHKFSVGVNALLRENRTWLLGEPFSFTPGEPSGTLRENLRRFWQEYSWRSATQALAAYSAFTVGRNNVAIDPSSMPTSNLPANDFRLWVGQFQYEQRVLKDGTSFIARGAVQRTSDRLTALDGFSIGGINSVRGFRENQLVRDRGAYLNIQVEIPLGHMKEADWFVKAVPFYDLGFSENVGEPVARIASAGLALHFERKAWRADIALAKRLESLNEADGQGTNLQDRGLHLQLRRSF
jgi:hemolysin activation/secretion protein